MTNAEKLTILQTLLDDGGALPSEDKLSTYLTLAGAEILNWMYMQVGGPSEDASVPERYEVTQIYAVVAGYTHAGSEGQEVHNENGVQQTFKYMDMVDYIRQNVLAIARVGAVDTDDDDDEDDDE